MAMVYGNCNAVCRLKGNGNGNAVYSLKGNSNGNWYKNDGAMVM